MSNHSSSKIPRRPSGCACYSLWIAVRLPKVQSHRRGCIIEVSREYLLNYARTDCEWSCAVHIGTGIHQTQDIATRQMTREPSVLVLSVGAVADFKILCCATTVTELTLIQRAAEGRFEPVLSLAADARMSGLQD